MRDEDDELLQFAIQQSLLDAGSEDEQVILYICFLGTNPQIGCLISAKAIIFLIQHVEIGVLN